MRQKALTSVKISHLYQRRRREFHALLSLIHFTESLVNSDETFHWEFFAIREIALQELCQKAARIFKDPRNYKVFKYRWNWGGWHSPGEELILASPIVFFMKPDHFIPLGFLIKHLGIKWTESMALKPSKQSEEYLCNFCVCRGGVRGDSNRQV